MKKIALLFLLFFVFFSCKIQDSKKQTLVRFKIGSIDKVEGVGFFDINKSVLYYSNGILYPFLDCYTVFSWKTLTNTQIITGESTVFIK